MRRDSAFRRQCHRAAVAILTVIALLLSVVVPAQAQLDQQTKHDARRKSIMLSRRSSVLSDVLQARGELVTYDKLLAVMPASERDTGILYALNKLRYEILEHAIGAYFHTGSMNLPADDAAVFSALCANEQVGDLYAMPPALDELVRCGYLPHLPESPYSGGSWLTAAPTADPEPGSVLYLAWAPKNLAFNTEPANECFLLVVFGHHDPMNDLTLDDAKDYFLGDLVKTMPYFPQGVKKLGGQDYDS